MRSRARFGHPMGGEGSTRDPMREPTRRDEGWRFPRSRHCVRVPDAPPRHGLTGEAKEESCFATSSKAFWTELDACFRGSFPLRVFPVRVLQRARSLGQRGAVRLVAPIFPGCLAGGLMKPLIQT